MYRPLGCWDEFWIKYFPFGFLFHLIDATLYDVWFALRCIFWLPYYCREYYEDRFMENIPVYSARSGFDLVLQALELPEGSEVLMSGLNITHVGLLPSIHGCRMVAYDINLETLEPDYEHLEKLVNEKSKVIVYAQLFGKNILFYKLSEFAKKHGLILIEDSSQYFPNTHYPGNHLADINIFSFGLSKNFSCFGGGLVRIEDKILRKKCWQIFSEYPIESRWNYLLTVLVSGVKIILSSTMFVWLIDNLARRFGTSFKKLLNKLSKEFGDQNNNVILLKKFRKQCSLPHLEVMYHKVRCNYTVLGDLPEIFDYHKKRNQMANTIAGRINYGVVGKLANEKDPAVNYWLLPILARNRDKLIDNLRNAGFIATKSATSFGYIGLLDEGSSNFCPQCYKFIDRVVYLPYGPEIPDDKIHEMISIVNRHQNEYTRPGGHLLSKLRKV